MTQSRGFASSSTSREWWLGQKQQNIGQGRCWRKQLLIDSSSGHLETIFILEFLPMLFKHPLKPSQMSCIDFFHFLPIFWRKCDRLQWVRQAQHWHIVLCVTHCHYNGCVFLPRFLFFHGFFRVLLWIQNILFFLFNKEKLEHREMKG